MKKKLLIFVASIIVSTSLSAQLKITAPGVKWDDGYDFDQYNLFKVDFYSAKGELMRSLDYRTYYQSVGENFSVLMLNKSQNNRIETIFDKKNEVAIQIFGVKKPDLMFNASRYKYPADEELKMLVLLPVSETKIIAGVLCKKYTYTYKKIFGEVWVTDQITLSNDLGVFRAAKMSAIHNTLSVGGFVMEMTTEDAKGGKTLMQTISLNNQEKYSVNLKGVDMQTAINKVSYFIF